MGLTVPTTIELSRAPRKGIKVTWSGAVADGSSKITGYKIFYACDWVPGTPDTSSPFVEYKLESAISNTKDTEKRDITIPNLQMGRIYYVGIRTIGENGEISVPHISETYPIRVNREPFVGEIPKKVVPSTTKEYEEVTLDISSAVEEPDSDTVTIYYRESDKSADGSGGNTNADILYDNFLFNRIASEKDITDIIINELGFNKFDNNSTGLYIDKYYDFIAWDGLDAGYPSCNNKPFIVNDKPAIKSVPYQYHDINASYIDNSLLYNGYKNKRDFNIKVIFQDKNIGEIKKCTIKWESIPENGAQSLSGETTLPIYFHEKTGDKDYSYYYAAGGILYSRKEIPDYTKYKISAIINDGIEDSDSFEIDTFATPGTPKNTLISGGIEKNKKNTIWKDFILEYNFNGFTDGIEKITVISNGKRMFWIDSYIFEKGSATISGNTYKYIPNRVKISLKDDVPPNANFSIRIYFDDGYGDYTVTTDNLKTAKRETPIYNLSVADTVKPYSDASNSKSGNICFTLGYIGGNFSDYYLDISETSKNPFVLSIRNGGDYAKVVEIRKSECTYPTGENKKLISFNVSKKTIADVIIKNFFQKGGSDNIEDNKVTYLDVKISIKNNFGVDFSSIAQLRVDMREGIDITSFKIYDEENKLVDIGTLIYEGDGLNFSFSGSCYNAQTITPIIQIARLGDSVTTIQENNWETYIQGNSFSVEAGEALADIKGFSEKTISYTVKEITASKYIYFRLVLIDASGNKYSEILSNTPFRSVKHTAPIFSLKDYKLENGKITELIYSCSDTGIDIIDGDSNITISTAVLKIKTSLSEISLSNVTFEEGDNKTISVGNINIEISSDSEEVSLILSTSVGGKTKEYTTNSIIVYNILPTVSYRQNHLGINTLGIDDKENENVIILIGEAKNKNIIRFVGTNNSKIKIEGFCIDGGTWD